MAKWKLWFALMPFILPRAQADENNSCNELLVSYSQQRSGGDPELVAKARDYSRKIKESLRQNPITPQIRQWLSEVKPTDAYRKSVALGLDRNVKLHQPLYNGLWSLVLESKQEESESIDLLLESREISSDPQLVYESFLVSPDQKHIALQYREYGSIDHSHILIFNLKEGRILVDLVAGHNYAWASDDRLIFEENGQDESAHYGLRVYDLDRGKTIAWSRTGGIDSSYLNWTVVTKGKQSVLLHDGNEYELGDQFPGGTLFGANEEFLFFRTFSETWSNTKIVRLAIKSLNSHKLVFEDLIPENAYRIAASGYRDAYILLERTFGEHVDVAVYKDDGTFVASIPIEGGVSIRSWKWKEVGEVLSLGLSNPIRSLYGADFDLKTKSFTTDIEQELLKGPNGEIYRTCVIHATSADGIRVPIRLFYRQLGGRNPCMSGRFKNPRPALIEAYGGFFLGGSFRSSYDPMYKKFVDRGGVLVGPALRGGDEFGGSWHHAGQKLAKPNTLSDLIATAEELIARGISTPTQIISTGTSNGGFVVAATTSLRPDLFGLTIPVNGVLDWSISSSLDSKYKGWSYEWGDDERKEISSMKAKYSPVNRASETKYNKLLVITGLNDSRVNPKHSYNFIKALEKGPTPPENIQWLAVKNTGHWAMSMSRQGLIARHMQAVVWSAIFEQAGFNK